MADPNLSRCAVRAVHPLQQHHGDRGRPRLAPPHGSNPPTPTLRGGPVRTPAAEGAQFFPLTLIHFNTHGHSTRPLYNPLSLGQNFPIFRTSLPVKVQNGYDNHAGTRPEGRSEYFKIFSCFPTPSPTGREPGSRRKRFTLGAEARGHQPPDKPYRISCFLAQPAVVAARRRRHGT